MAERVGFSDPIDTVFFQTGEKTNFYLIINAQFDWAFCFPAAFKKDRVQPFLPRLFPLNLQEGDNQVFSNSEDKSTQAHITYSLDKSTGKRKKTAEKFWKDVLMDFLQYANVY